MNRLEKIDRKNIWHPFSPLAKSHPVFIKKARGLYLYTQDGRKIMDVISSWWVNIHGHSHPKISRAIKKQVSNLEQVIFAGFTHEPAIRLSKLLLRLLPGQSRMFFSDDGSTSTEVALKLAIQYWHNQGIHRKKIIAIEGAYHGDTFGAMSLGGENTFTLPFVDYLFDVKFLPFPEGDGENTINRMKELASDDVAAFIFEPLVQGAAGMRMYSPRVLDSLLEIAGNNEIICIADEVMTGFGRTGKIFASDHLKHQPDIFCLSKGLTGGFLPMGITTMNKKIVDAFDDQEKEKAFFHGHSYTANPMACAAALASTKLLLKRSCLRSIKRISKRHEKYIRNFSSHPSVNDVRSTGTILAIELKASDAGYTSKIKDKIYDHFLNKGILLRPLGNVIYMIPPYVITDSELTKVYDEMDRFISELL